MVCILNAADEALKAVERLKAEKEKSLLTVEVSRESIQEWQKLTGMASENVASEIEQLISVEIDFHKSEQGID